MKSFSTRIAALAVACAAVASMAACGGSASGTDANASASAGPLASVNVGYFPNVTHAMGIVAQSEGLFSKYLGDTKVSIKTFNAGPDAMTALASGAVDATLVGPGPATTEYLNSDGKAVTIIAGAASGGASLVVQPSIISVDQLKGKKVASPQLGNTQDIAMRYYFKTRGLKTDLQGGGDVNITPMSNSDAVNAFKSKQIAGGWLPEPYATQLVQAGGKRLVDEKSLWSGGTFATTVLAVNTSFIKAHPDTVKEIVEGLVSAAGFIAKNPSKSQQDVANAIGALSGKPIAVSLVSDAWKNITFTVDPVKSSIQTGADHAYAVGILKDRPTLTNLVDLTVLNSVLKANAKPEIK